MDARSCLGEEVASMREQIVTHHAQHDQRREETSRCCQFGPPHDLPLAPRILAAFRSRFLSAFVGHRTTSLPTVHCSLSTICQKAVCSPESQWTVDSGQWTIHIAAIALPKASRIAPSAERTAPGRK